MTEFQPKIGTRVLQEIALLAASLAVKRSITPGASDLIIDDLEIEMRRRDLTERQKAAVYNRMEKLSKQLLNRGRKLGRTTTTFRAEQTGVGWIDSEASS